MILIIAYPILSSSRCASKNSSTSRISVLRQADFRFLEETFFFKVSIFFNTRTTWNRTRAKSISSIRHFVHKMLNEQVDAFNMISYVIISASMFCGDVK